MLHRRLPTADLRQPPGGSRAGDSVLDDPLRPACGPNLIALLFCGTFLGVACGLFSLRVISAASSPALGTPGRAQLVVARSRDQVDGATIECTQWPQLELYAHGDASASSEAPAPTVEACCQQCFRHEGCSAFTFDRLRQRCSLVVQHEALASVSGRARSWYISGAPSAGVAPELDVLVRAALSKKRLPEATWLPTESRWPRRLKLVADYATKNGERKHRKDYTGVLREAAVDGLGLALTDDLDDWDVYWGLQWETLGEFQRASLRRGQVLNMLPGVVRLTLGDKDALHRSAERARLRHGEDALDFMPRSYMLPDQLAAFHRTRSLGGNGAALWVMKELSSWSGAGITIVRADEVESQLRTHGAGGEVLLQEYVQRPLTLSGHKFDVRWWAVVTSVEPLRMYALEDAYLKVAKSARYDPSPANAKNRCMHVTNNKVQSECSSRGGRHQRRPVVSRFPPNIRSAEFAEMVADADGMRLGGEKSVDVAELVRRTVRAMVRSVLMVLPELRAHVREAGVQDSRCFQFLAFDVIYDDATSSPWVEEVNANGFLGGGMVGVPRGRQHLRSMLELAGVAGYDRGAYQEDFERRLLTICNGVCSADTMAKLQDAMDEFSHRGEWKLAYPDEAGDYGDLLSGPELLDDITLSLLREGSVRS